MGRPDTGARPLWDSTDDDAGLKTWTSPGRRVKQAKRPRDVLLRSVTSPGRKGGYGDVPKTSGDERFRDGRGVLGTFSSVPLRPRDVKAGTRTSRKLSGTETLGT